MHRHVRIELDSLPGVERWLNRQRQVLDLGLIVSQTSLTRLSVTDDHRWCFIAPESPPALPLALQELCLEGQESAIDPPNYQILLNYLDLQALKVLGIKGTWLVAAVLEDLRGEVPNLEVIRLDGGQYPLRYLSNDMIKNEYDSISRFFDRTRLCNISIHNITQDVLNLDFVSASGPALRRLAIHVTDDYWNFLPDRSIPSSGVRALSATQDHLGELNSMCPNIERLGLDVSGLTVAEARHGPLDSLLRFRRLRHLHLFFHPPEGTRESPCKLTLLSGLDLVQLFLHLHDHNPVVKLETLLYRHTRSEEECMVWHTGQRRLLLSYRYDVLKRPDPAMEVREIYEGTRLVRTWKQLMEKGMIFDEKTFPG
ncbi:MAG: hypothetical protein LQ344_002589 [Seirophora lacunosa]|nr:MAG: hypothetical protein LQ344_002589 [Seirophora lacunosa]